MPIGCGSGERDDNSTKQKVHSENTLETLEELGKHLLKAPKGQVYSHSTEGEEMAKAAIRGLRGGGRGGRWALRGPHGRLPRWPPAWPADPQASALGPLATFCLSSSSAPGQPGEAPGEPCEAGPGDPRSRPGVRRVRRAAAALTERRRAAEAFEMRGAADHWSPGQGWERAAASEGPRPGRWSLQRAQGPAPLRRRRGAPAQSAARRNRGASAASLAREETR